MTSDKISSSFSILIVDDEPKNIQLLGSLLEKNNYDIVKAFEAGCSDFITKPFKAPELLVRVKKELELKILRGLMPICSYCKKIRDDKGYWNQIEAYISDHSEAEFSHGICQECVKKYYPDMDLDGD